MSLPPPASDSLALVTGASSGIGEQADNGRTSVIPGGPQVRAALGPNRRLPRWLVLPISKRMMARS